MTGTDPSDRRGNIYPVIAGVGTGPVVSFIHGEDPNCMLTGFVITQGQGPSDGAIWCQASSPTISHCLIVGNRAADPSGSAVVCSDSHAVFIHCTISDNVGGAQAGGMTLVNSPVMVTNSIIWGNTPNQIIVSGASRPSIQYTDIAGGWPGPGNIHADPLFARPGYWADANDPDVVVGPKNPKAVWIEGDYHLKSQTGRWDPKTRTWVLDDVTSGCIDAGDPSSSLGYEPAPNGGVANLGTYGGTVQASKSFVADTPVHFKNPLLKLKVEAALGILDPTPTDMLGLTSLTAAFGVYDIVDLTGLEHAVNLQTLILNDNRLTDLTPLSGLSNLRTLDVSDNYVLSDLSGISGLSGLQDLDVHRNAIWDLRPISTMTGLRTLTLRTNKISDIGPLSSLSNLEGLNVQDNTIDSISALSGLTSLKQLDLTSNLFNTDAYWIDLQKVYDNNPNLWLWYDSNRSPPTGVLASDAAYPNRVQITWYEVRNGPYRTTRYRVYRATSAGDPKTPISGWQEARSFDDTTAQAATTYTYWVQAAPYGDGSEAGEYSAPDTGWR